MIDGIFATMRSVAEGWRQEVARRRAVSKTDAVADALEYAASELEDQVRRLESDSAHLTPEQWAELHGCSAQTARNMIRDGRLPAVRGPKGYLIARGADVKRGAA